MGRVWGHVPGQRPRGQSVRSDSRSKRPQRFEELVRHPNQRFEELVRHPNNESALGTRVTFVVLSPDPPGILGIVPRTAHAPLVPLG